ncbi:MAG: hypothetical protein WC479_06960 [Candidatus Izemoplasmatales bacterium]
MSETKIRKTQIEDLPFDGSTGHKHSGAAGDGQKININDLGDVNTSGVADGNTILYDEATSTWLPGEAGGSSGSGLQSRTTTYVETDSLAPQATDSGKTLSLGKCCSVIRLQTSRAAWVRVYSTSAHQSADAARSQTTDPVGEHGVLLEVITESSNLTLDLNPAALVFSLDAGQPDTVCITVKNLDENTGTVVVTATYVQLEA